MYLSAVAVPASRTKLVSAVQTALGVDAQKADAIVTAFDQYVAKPLAANLTKLRGRDLAKRNPMIYAVRGVTSVDEWVDRVLEDKETSAIEGHIGTWQEEVARIVSGGFKPGSGVDLQRDQPGNTSVIELYAIQSAPNTKSSGGRRSDVDALHKGAAALRASKRPVEMNIAVLSGRSTTRPLRADPNVVVLASDDFWGKVSGISDFRARLIRVTSILSVLIEGRAAVEVARIKKEAKQLFDDGQGGLKLDALADPPTLPRRRGPKVSQRRGP
jgi:hypothetical protein